VGQREQSLLHYLVASHETNMSSHYTKGFFLIEVVIVASVIATVLMYLLGSIQNSVEVSQRSLERTQAAYLLEEGAEAIKSIRNATGGWTILNAAANGVTQYLSWNGSVWSLTTTPQMVDIFTRTVVFSSVNRDAASDIVSSGGTLDTRTRKAVITVSWLAQSTTKSESVTLYLTDI